MPQEFLEAFFLIYTPQKNNKLQYSLYLDTHTITKHQVLT